MDGVSPVHHLRLLGRLRHLVLEVASVLHLLRGVEFGRRGRRRRRAGHHGAYGALCAASHRAWLPEDDHVVGEQVLFVHFEWFGALVDGIADKDG